jgi:CheY-like chemotaxis protein/Zn-finger nucleic acid-binding protein
MPVKPSEQEEEYVAKRDRERRKQVLAERQPPAGAEAYQQEVAIAQFRCPTCGALLVEMHYKGIEIDKCFQCQGIWLDCGKLEPVIAREQGFLKALTRIVASGRRHMAQPYDLYLHEKRNEPPLYRNLAALCHRTAAAVAGKAVSDEALQGQREMILLVDDEPLVREALCELLEHLHYRVLTAVNGKEALAVYEQHGDAIALVLTDLVMPEMGGVELCRALQQRNPHVKTLVMTGCPLGEEGQALQEESVLGWLQKPFTLPELAQTVCQAL